MFGHCIGLYPDYAWLWCCIGFWVLGWGWAGCRGFPGRSLVGSWSAPGRLSASSPQPVSPSWGKWPPAKWREPLISISVWKFRASIKLSRARINLPLTTYLDYFPVHTHHHQKALENETFFTQPLVLGDLLWSSPCVLALMSHDRFYSYIT